MSRIENKSQSMYDYLVDNLSVMENRELINIMDYPIKKDKFLRDTDALAAYLYNLGIRKNHSVAINLPNFAQAIIAFYAINKCGAIANIIHPLIPTDGLIPLIKKTKAKYLFTMDIFLKDKVDALLSQGITPIVCSINDYSNLYKKPIISLATRNKTKSIKNNDNLLYYSQAIKSMSQYKNIEYPSINDGDDAVVLHSGGTTGEPKSIRLSNYALNSLAISLKDLMNYTPDTFRTILAVLPLFHGFGLGVCMHSCLTAGYRLVLVPSFKPKNAIKLIKKHKISIIAGVPTMYAKMLEEKTFRGDKLKYLEYLFCGGDKLSVSLKTEFDRRLKECGSIAELLEGYGLTEVVTVCTVNRVNDVVANSVGKPLSSIHLKIIDADNNTLPPNCDGEICVTGNTLMSGYLDDEVATKECFLCDDDGVVWVKTGDCGYLDHNNNLFFKDRLKRLIKISGMNIFPAEIESLVNTLKEIKHSCVKEYTENNKTYLELFIVLNPNYTCDKSLLDKINTLLKSQLIKYSIPKKITERKSLPLTKIGKVDYNKVK